MKFQGNQISNYVIVMGIINCENVFAGIFIFSSLFDRKQTRKIKLKITAKTFSHA